MGMKTIAEFFENDEINEMSQKIGVDYAQGYGIDEPQPLEKILADANKVIDIKNAKSLR